MTSDGGMRIYRLSNFSHEKMILSAKALVTILVGFFLIVGCSSSIVLPEFHENPKSANDYAQRGKYYLIKENYLSAVADFTQAIKLQPKETKYYSDRSSAYLGLDDVDNAITDIDTMIALNPKEYGIYLRKANLLFQEARITEAIHAYRAFLEGPSPSVGRAKAAYFLPFQGGLIGMAFDTHGTIASARNMVQVRESAEKIFDLCEMMLQEVTQSDSVREVTPGMSMQTVLQRVLVTDKIIETNPLLSIINNDLLVTVTRMGPVEERNLRVLIFDNGFLTMEKRVTLKEIMEIPGVSKYNELRLSGLTRNMLVELIRKTDCIIYEDDKIIVTVTECDTRKGKRIKTFYLNQNKLWFHIIGGSGKLW